MNYLVRGDGIVYLKGRMNISWIKWMGPGTLVFLAVALVAFSAIPAGIYAPSASPVPAYATKITGSQNSACPQADLNATCKNPNDKSPAMVGSAPYSVTGGGGQTAPAVAGKLLQTSTAFWYDSGLSVTPVLASSSEIPLVLLHYVQFVAFCGLLLSEFVAAYRFLGAKHECFMIKDGKVYMARTNFERDELRRADWKMAEDAAEITRAKRLASKVAPQVLLLMD